MGVSAATLAGAKSAITSTFLLFADGVNFNPTRCPNGGYEERGRATLEDGQQRDVVANCSSMMSTKKKKILLVQFSFLF